MKKVLTVMMVFLLLGSWMARGRSRDLTLRAPTSEREFGVKP